MYFRHLVGIWKALQEHKRAPEHLLKFIALLHMLQLDLAIVKLILYEYTNNFSYDNKSLVTLKF